MWSRPGRCFPREYAVASRAAMGPVEVR